MLGDFKAEIAKVAAESAEAAVKKYADELAPEVKAGYAGHVQIEKDEAEQPFKTAGEFLTAVKNAAVLPHEIDRGMLNSQGNRYERSDPLPGRFPGPTGSAGGNPSADVRRWKHALPLSP